VVWQNVSLEGSNDACVGDDGRLVLRGATRTRPEPVDTRKAPSPWVDEMRTNERAVSLLRMENGKANAMSPTLLERLEGLLDSSATPGSVITGRERFSRG